MPDWAVVLHDRSDRAGVLMLLPDQAEAEKLATGLRRRGQDVDVHQYLTPNPTLKSRPPRKLAPLAR